MDDTISRQAAIDAILHNQEVYSNNFGNDPIDKYTIAIIDNDAQTIAQLPSAQPTYKDEEIQKMQDLEQAQIEKAYQLGYEEGKKDAQPERKKGRWIMHIDDLFPEESTMECNQCHEHQPITIDDNFCPNCGAEMQKGEADETD